ncbi:hypothetical protein, partial [Capnocytophaga ochracea]|uniref:hypothetical protein n=1 Tax=Capnocytophaga ochracea TaxID=1018 RepID=UPI002B4A0EF2
DEQKTNKRRTKDEQKTVRAARADKQKTKKGRTKDEQKTNNERRITRVKIYLNCIQSGTLVEKTYFFEIIFRSFKKK